MDSGGPPVNLERDSASGSMWVNAARVRDNVTECWVLHAWAAWRRTCHGPKKKDRRSSEHRIRTRDCCELSGSLA